MSKIIDLQERRRERAEDIAAVGDLVRTVRGLIDAEDVAAENDCDCGELEYCEGCCPEMFTPQRTNV